MASLDDAVSTLKNLTQNVSAIYTQMLNMFPQANGTASSATAGAATLPAAPTAFLEITYNNVQYKVPLYKV
jgi:mevalonate pyrophosphate decarboxylase